MLAILSERVRMQQSLQASGAGSNAELLSVQDQQVRVEADLADTSAQLAEIGASIRNLKEQQAQAVASFLAEQSKAFRRPSGRWKQLDQENPQTAGPPGSSRSSSPDRWHGPAACGDIHRTGRQSRPAAPHHRAGKCRPGGRSARSLADIGFVAEGDEVVVKADAFPFTRYGSLKAR